MENTSVQIFTGSNLVAFNDKKGNTHEITAEGALFKGGAALRAYKDLALMSGFEKAKVGRYRAASDILAAAFPKAHKAFVGFMMTEPHNNKNAFALFIDKCEMAEAGKNGWTKKQIEARALLSALREIPALARQDDAYQVINA